MKNKIIFCVPEKSAFRLPILKSLNRLGFEIKEFDFQKGNFLTRCIGLLNNTFFNKSDYLKKIPHDLIQTQLLKLVKYWKPDILLVIKGHEIDSQTIQTVRKMGVITINWYPDWLVLWDWVRKNCQNYSYFISTCHKLFTEVKKIHPQALYLPSASDPDPVLYNGPKLYDITFIGNYTPRREKYFKHISDLGLRIWGYPTWSVSTLNKIVFKQVSTNTALQIIRKSKICVNILTGDDNFQPDTLNNRLFESLGTGTFMLIKKYPLLTKYFDNGKDFVTFISPPELRKKVIYYLAHNKEREIIAKAGWQKAKKYHTYDVRLKELFNKIYYEI